MNPSHFTRGFWGIGCELGKSAVDSLG